jgi:ribosomal protein S18 acetylase RimI-like enzyme
VGLPTVCVCNWEIPGDGPEARLAALRIHCDDTHAAYELQDHDLRDYLEALQRMDPPPPRLDAIGPIEVHRATLDRIPDTLDYFDVRAFADFPIWGACYCQCHHVAPAQWPARDRAQNRAGLIERLEGQTTTGYLAYVEGKVAGWCNASERAAYPHYDESRPAADGTRTGAIVCFVIASPYRRHGVARALLEAAVEGFREGGFDAVEAFPRRQTEDNQDAYHGPLKLYLDAGFTEVDEAERWAVVRKELTERDPAT